MTYVVEGLDPKPFEPLFRLGEEELARLNGRFVTADGPGYPCRVALEEADAGERLLLINHVSHDTESPFRTAYAIYVCEGSSRSPAYVDQLPPLLDRRTLGLRGFSARGMLLGARLAGPGDGDDAVRDLFMDAEVESIHAHNAAQGCFLARIARI